MTSGNRNTVDRGLRDVIGDVTELGGGRRTKFSNSSGQPPAALLVGERSSVSRDGIGVDQSVVGTLAPRQLFHTGDAIPVGRVLQPRVEAEMAFVLGADLSET
jgi:2-keto-4-pentenoate hydratase